MSVARWFARTSFVSSASRARRSGGMPSAATQRSSNLTVVWRF